MAPLVENGAGAVDGDVDVTAAAPPVIDLTMDDAAITEAISNACKRWGFFQVVNHGVDPVLRSKFDKYVRDFFALPMDEKLRVERSADNARGFTRSEMTKNKLDHKQCFDVGNWKDFDAEDNAPINQGLNGVNRFPEDHVLPGFRKTFQEYFKAKHALAERIGEYMAMGLGVERSYFKDSLTNMHTSHLRLNYYPHIDDPSSALGVGPHTDAGFLTLLAQDEEVHTLQVHDRFADEWKTVHPVSGAYTINTGDLCVVFSNGLYHAPLHRVLSHDKERFSTPYFYNPSYQSEIAPIANVHGPSAFHPLKWGYFRAMRVMGNFGDYGEYVKVDMWKKNEDASLPKHVARQEKFMQSVDFDAPFDINTYVKKLNAVSAAA